ncbi:non-ribosomal peptide synthetase [Streptomyces sp. 5.8]|uniref:non-ribosomal peptide synthetase n=1 Tax=Streptomyces sp. 5.8 TaxID=3406571 RepID=UPI003BB5837F
MFALSPSQEIVWLHEQLLPGSRAYNFTATIDLWGPLRALALGHALADAFARHRGLRLELVPGGPGELPRQQVSEDAVPRLRRADLSELPDPEAAFEELLRTEAELPFDLHEAPLMRWTLVRMGELHHRVVHVEHHLIHDGHSFAILLREVFEGYRSRLRDEDGGEGEAPGDPSAATGATAARSYEEYVAEVTGLGARSRRADALKFWRGQLDGASFDLPLPGLTKPGAERRHAGGQFRQAVGADLADRLRAHSRAEGHTPFTTLLALFAELLRRHSARTDLVIGTAVRNRPEGHGQTVGMFVNTIPVRLRPDAAASARDLVDEVTDTLIRCLPHQHLPVQELTRALGLHTDDGTDNPLFSVMFSTHDTPLPEIDLSELEVSLFEGYNTGTTRFDLDVVLLPDDRRTVGVRRGGAGMTLVWDYDRDLFDEADVALLAGRFLDLLRGYIEDPTAVLASLAPAAETVQSTAPDAAPAGGRLPVAGDLRNPLAGHPRGATAVVAGAHALTYAALDHEVTTLVERLRVAGVTEGVPVAAVLPRGVESVVALLACLRVGAVYCPLSPGDPAARLEALLVRLGPALVLATRESALTLPARGLPLALLDTPTDSGTDPAGLPFPPAAPAVPVPGAAYVIHTSGSTGLPKPVVVGLDALAHHAHAVVRRFGLVPEDRVLLFAQPSFDVALEEVLPALLAGACLVLPHRDVPTGPELAAVLAARRITVANLPTSYVLAVRNELCDVLTDGLWTPRLLVLGGERLPAASLAPLLAAGGPRTTLLNAYGVTEATITSTVQEVTAALLDEVGRAGDVPLGTPLPGVTVHVLDRAGHHPLPAGAVGEIAVAGPGLAAGYLGDAEATARRFVTVEALGGARVYLTGDLGHLDSAGRLRFLGRGDHQVKLRGYRIELEEVEAAASAALAGRPCAVVLDAAAPAGPRLVGFVRSAAPVDQAVLHRELSARLPAALVPGQWIALDELPVLAGGKPDRTRLGKLAADAGRAHPDGPDSGPRGAADDPVLEVVGEGWRHVLGHDRFTPSSHFFQVGGHSLLAARLAAWLEPKLGYRPPLHTLLRHPVLSDQADALRDPVEPESVTAPNPLASPEPQR